MRSATIMMGLSVVLMLWAGCTEEDPIDSGGGADEDGGPEQGDTAGPPGRDMDASTEEAPHITVEGRDATTRDADPAVEEDDASVPDTPDPTPTPGGLGDSCNPGRDECGDGLWCGEGAEVCCPAGQDCCATPDECPATYSNERGCVDPSSCWGSVEEPTCIDHVCGSAFVASDTDHFGCDAVVCAEPLCEGSEIVPARLCDGTGTCVGDVPAACADDYACDSVSTCGTTCEVGTVNGCAFGYECEASDDGPVCVLIENPGDDCSGDAGGPSVCVGTMECNPENERCCEPGEVCCQQANDCPDQFGEVVLRGDVCADTATCRGESRSPSCSDNVCGFVAVDTGSLCDTLTCDGGVCDAGNCVPRRVGEACSEDDPCLSREGFQPAPDADGSCAGAAGEPCLPTLTRCLAGGVCWYGDAEGKTFKCHPAPCVGLPCVYWNGDEDGWCDGTIPDFLGATLGSPISSCYNDGTGTVPHEAACFNQVDDDFDGLIDSDDPDCQPGTGDFWITAVDRPVRGQCSLGLCGASDASGASQCESGVGGCFDGECHSTICWPDAGECANQSTAETLCKWWDSAFDLDDTCEAAELIDRPDGSLCGPGCICEGAIGSEFLCADGRDNDLDGLLDGADPDCQRQHGDSCYVGHFNGAPDPGNGNASYSGYAADTDQCEGLDHCWCADADCTTGVCLDDQSDCISGALHWCNSYAAPTETDCGTAVPRTAGAIAAPSFPGAGGCDGGFIVPVGAGQPGETCNDWYDCESTFCLCGSDDCSQKVCWAGGDCAGNACFYRVSDSECQPVLPDTDPIACGGGDYGGVDTTGKCQCLAGGVMAEIDCNDGISNDWPQWIGGPQFDSNADWSDIDCYLPIEGTAAPWALSIHERYNRDSP